MADLKEIVVNFQGKLYLNGNRVIAEEVERLNNIKASEEEVKRRTTGHAPENADAYSSRRKENYITIIYYKIKKVIDKKERGSGRI